ncbi:MAG: erythromycin esterase family protein [Acidobacteriota bacterium]
MTSTISTVMVCLAIVGFAVALQAQPIQPAPACGAKVEQLPQLTLLSVPTGRLAPGETTCFGLVVEQGEFIRISVEAEGVWVCLRARVLEPRQHNPLQVTWACSFSPPSLPLAFEASTTGLFIVELSIPPAVPFKDTVPFRIQVLDRLSARAQAARLDDLRRDPRTAWLRQNAVPIRSIDPQDEDYSDLQFLREDLRHVRVVLLGEGDHGGGSDFKAKTRLVKFLHRQMGFDVLAFESGLFTTTRAWAALQTDADPREAFLKGVVGIWGQSEQVQPLIRYIHSSARSDRPLELTGFDIQFSGTAQDSFLPAMRQVLRQHGIDTPLADENSAPARILAGILDGRFAQEREDLPSAAEQARSMEALRAAAVEVERTVRSREGSFWAQVLRSSAVQLGLLLENLRDPDEEATAYRRGRDRQMAENLIWLANTYFRDRKIIVWVHTFHAMRNPRATTSGRVQGFTMGHGLWEALGRESFAIGFTSYRGSTHWVTLPDGFDQDVVPDQHPSFEFEELMDAAGHELAYVNLREGRARHQWLGGSFVASLLYLRPQQATWSDVLDAVFFIRTQEPSRRVGGVR